MDKVNMLDYEICPRKKKKQLVGDSENEIQDRLKGISPSERLGSMLESGLYSDCSFLVEGNEIKAHKLVLALASPKMESLFLGAEDPTEPVQVPYSLRVMQLVLKHCYLQDMDIDNIDEAQDIIEAANYFEMKDLVELCCAGIEPQTLDDLWPALNLACTYKSRALKESCLSMALKHSSTILNHDGLLQLSPEALSYLLSREVIEVNTEKDILDIVMAWAQYRLENQDGDLRTELEQCDLLKNIRILALTEIDFIDFITGIGQEVFNKEELEKIEFNYFSDSCDNVVSPIRTDRMLEQRVPICGYDYLSVNSEKDILEINVKIYEQPSGIRPIIKTIILPSQINPANILYNNVSHKTHYNECILIELSVNNKIMARGSFFDRIKYSDDININLNTFNPTLMYANQRLDDLGMNKKYYEATIKIMFKTFGFYPLAIETKSKENSPIEMIHSSRFIHEIVLTSPKL